MNGRRAHLALWTLTALLGAGAVGSVLLAVALPVGVKEEASPPAAAHRAAVETVRAQPGIDELRQVWEAPLRQQLIEGATRPAVAGGQGTAATPSQAPVPITLVGTIGQTLALVKINNTSVVEVRGVGEKFAGVEIVAVRPAEADVKFNGRVVTLKKPADPAAKKSGI